MDARRRQAGFSLLDILIGSMIFMVVLGGVYVLQQTAQTTYDRAADAASLQQVTRLALDRMAQDLRMSGYGSPKLTDPVVIATNDTVSVHADPDGTGAVYITYSLRDCTGTLGTTLYRQASTTSFCGGDTIATGVAVTGMQFTYYEMQNVPLPYPTPSPPTYQLDGQAPIAGAGAPSTPAVGSQRDRVRQIKLVLTLSNGSAVRPQFYTATTEITLRNLLP